MKNLQKNSLQKSYKIVSHSIAFAPAAGALDHETSEREVGGSDGEGGTALESTVT